MPTRDSVIWTLGMIGAVVIGLATLSDPTAYGIPATWLPYIRLMALIVGIASGKLATSPLPGATDASKVDVTKIGTLVLAVALLGSMAACGPKTVATAATISDQFSKALVIAQSGVIDAKASGVISAATSDKVQAVLEKVATAGLAVNQALRSSDSKGALAQVQAAIGAIETCIREDIPRLPEHDKATALIVLSTLKGALVAYAGALGGAA